MRTTSGTSSIAKAIASVEGRAPVIVVDSGSKDATLDIARDHAAELHEHEFIDYLRRSHEGILAGIRETTKFDDDAEAELAAAYDSFLDQFETSDGQSIKAGKEEHVALEDEDVEQEQIVRQKKA